MADTAVKRAPDAVETTVSQKAKRTKADGDNGGGEVGKESESEDILCGFKTSSVLSDSAREKNIFIRGKVRL